MKACILSVSGPVLRADEADLFHREQPWAIILMGRSCVTRRQVKKLVDDIWSAMDRPCLIFIDQEGGRVARLKAPEWPEFPAGETYVDLFRVDRETGLEAAWLGHRLIAHELAELGIHADCSPVVDVRQDDAHDIIGDRAFGSDPATVAALAGAALKGLQDGGVAGVVKHIPGHGRAYVDSHAELPVVTAGMNALSDDFAAFEFVREAPMAMTAHIAYEAIDPGVPATLSRKLIDEIIRCRIGFDGLLMSDDLGMKALGGTLRDRATGALAAGCDVVLHCSGFVKEADRVVSEMTEVAEASSSLGGDALRRAKAAEATATRLQSFDPVEGWQRFETLLSRSREAA